MTAPLISVVISTHNPNPTRLQRTLAGLEAQSLDKALWRLILVDNASHHKVNLHDLPHGKMKILLTREDQLGLTYGRCKGISCIDTPLATLVDDDNVLSPSYLAEAVDILQKSSNIGLGGGKSLPEFEVAPPEWVHEFYGNLALRDLGEEIILASGSGSYPASAPIGAGMIARSELLQSWALQASRSNLPGRKGTALTSGEDCDLVMHALRLGWQVGYFPSLELRHLIPKERLEPTYLARLNYGIAKSWVAVLDANGIRPWPRAAWGLALRKARAYVRNRTWASDLNYIRWRGACGAIEGRAMIRPNTATTPGTSRPNVPAAL